MNRLLLVLLLLPLAASAQQSQRFGPYELHYSVVNTTFLQPDVAASYDITRGKRRSILNLALREHVPEGGTVARAMRIEGRSWDLTQQTIDLDFQEVREGGAIYYIAQFKFLNEEWRHFDLRFLPENSDDPLEFKFRQQMYTEQ